MVRLRVVAEDGRTATQRATALHEARAKPEARALLVAVLEPLRSAVALVEHDPGRPEVPTELWALLDQAYEALDRYLGHLLHDAAVDPSCGPRCSACCTDLPPVLPIEALRMVRALRERPGASVRLQRSVGLARAFQKILVAQFGGEVTAAVDFTDPRYRSAQLIWRRLGHPCPVLGDEGNCTAYASRPLSCRAHIHVEDPAHCEPASSRFTEVERPPLWGHPREAEVEVLLANLGKLLGLPALPNLQWGLARLHDHPAGTPEPR
ncbi:YkgJ family cysteine cluster protein [Nannocystaceae bacterium ST9]